MAPEFSWSAARSCRSGRGDAVIINTREVHYAKGSPGSTTRWGWLNLDPLRLLSDIPESCSGIVKLSRCCGNDFRNVIDGQFTGGNRQLYPGYPDRVHGHHPNSRPMVRALVWRLLLLLTATTRSRQTMGGPEPAPPPTMATSNAWSQRLNHIAANFQNTPSVTQLAARCFMSEANFRKCFARHGLRTQTIPAEKYACRPPPALLAQAQTSPSWTSPASADTPNSPISTGNSAPLPLLAP
jgi:hypothetical protein